MNIDGHSQLGTFFEQWLHSRVIDMNAVSRCWLRIKFTQTFITQFTDTLRAFFITSLEFCQSTLLPSGLIKTGIVESTPYIETVFVARIFVNDRIKPFSGRIRKDD